MSTKEIETKSLKLVPLTPEEVRAQIERMAPHEKAELSPAWLARLRVATSVDPWTLGFALVHRGSGGVIGSVGFKGPPAADGMVEIAYGVDPDYQGKGYATEAARALVAFAFGSGRVRVVRAHTIAETNASARVLVKCGFQPVGKVMEPEDGWVWRWEQRQAAAEPKTVLFSESFEDAKLTQRDWYDGTEFRIVGDARAGRGCIEYEWRDGGSQPAASSGVRHLFEPTDEICLRFYLKFSKGWGWSGRNYHPHLLHFMTTENSKWHGPAASHLTLYIEPVNGKLRLAA